MIDETEARALVDRFLAELSVRTKKQVAVVEGETQEHSFGWVFFYNSVKYLETGDDRAMMFGNGPLIVDRVSGVIHQCGTADRVEYYVKNYIATGDPFAEGSAEC